MNHCVDKYISKRLKELKWPDKTLVEKSGISKGQISKLKNGTVERLTAEIFYRIYTTFKDSCSKASKIVYPTLDLTLNKYVTPQRSDFGQFMLRFEKIENSIEEISGKTGINDNRIKEIYFRKGAPEAHEFLLIEKAIGKEPGELFEEYYGDGERPVVGEARDRTTD